MVAFFDQVVSTNGQASLAAAVLVDHVSTLVIVRGGLIMAPDYGALDHIIRAGWVALGAELDADGTMPHQIYWQRQQWVDFDAFVFDPGPDQLPATHVRWWMSPGTQTHLFVGGQVASVVNPNTLMQPWDRHPTVWNQRSAVSVAGGVGLTQAWSYTVPAGRILRVEKLSARVIRDAVATAALFVQGSVQTDVGQFLMAHLVSNVLGAETTDSLSASPLDLPAGATIYAQYRNADTGGNATIHLFANGFLFDA